MTAAFVIDEAARQGLLVILDCHSGPDDGYTQPRWYGPEYSEDDWVEAWKGLPGAIGIGANVVGADLKNEPHGEATWGTGGPTDWRRAATRARNAVLSTAPRWLILVRPDTARVLADRWHKEFGFMSSGASRRCWRASSAGAASMP